MSSLRHVKLNAEERAKISSSPMPAMDKLLSGCHDIQHNYIYIMTLSRKGLFAVLSVNDTQNNSISAIMLSVIMLNVIFYLLLR